MDTEYKCTLSEACLKQAQDELNEDPKNRLSAVQTLREWILQQPHLTCRTETTFLMKFLRTSKFSQLRAREMLEGYLGLKTDQSQWYRNWNPKDPDMDKFFKAGVFVPLPGYLKNGIKIVVYRTAQVSEAIPKGWTTDQRDAFIRYWFSIIYYLMDDENTQVSGIIYLMDFTHFPMKILTMFNFAETRDHMKFQGNVPVRFKGYWFYNESAAVDAFIALFRPFMKQKLLDRVRFLGNNLEKLYEEVPKHMLPREYLPDDYDGPNAGTFKSLAENIYKEMTKEEVLKELLYETDPKWGIDKSKKPTDVSPASFRKLNID